MTTSPHLIKENILFVIIDLQEKLLTAIPRSGDVVSSAVTLLEAGRILQIPAIVTSQYSRGLGGLAPQFQERWDGEVLDKTTFSCGADDEIRNRIDRIGREWIALAGVETHICVMQTALDLLRNGRRVAVVADAVAARKEQDHDLALRRMEQSGALIVTREMLLYELLRQAGTPEFKQILPLIKN